MIHPNSQFIDPGAGELFIAEAPVCAYGPLILDESIYDKYLFTGKNSEAGTREVIAPLRAKGKCIEVSVFGRSSAINSENDPLKTFNAF